MRVRAFRAHAAHVDHHIEGQHAPIGQAQRAAALARLHGQHARAPMPIDILRAIVQRRHRGHGVYLPLARQQPSVRGALHRWLQRAQRCQVKRLHALARAGRLPLGRGGGRLQPVQHALRGTQVGAVRQHQAAFGPDQFRAPQLRGDLPPQGNRAPAQRSHGGLGVVQFGQRAEHARRRERSRRGHVGIGRLAARDGLRAARRVEHADAMPRPGQLPSQQPTQQAGTGDAHVQGFGHE